MEELLNPRVKAIQISGIRRFFNKVADYPEAMSLTIGQPDFPTPEHIKEAAKRAIDQNYTSYTHNAGMMELRQAIQQFVEKKYQLHYDAASEIIATTGASEAIDITLRTLLEPGDEVLLPGPVYPGYEPVIHMCQAHPVHIDTTETEFKLTVDGIKQAITDKTKCLILPYPSNPTGMVLTPTELEAMATYLKDQNIFIISDEIYSELTYGTKHTSIATFDGMREKTIVINGLSKSHAMTGWRMGFLLAPEAIAPHLLKVHQYNVTCVSSITQYAALEALTNGIDDAAVMREAYQKRLDYAYGRLLEMGLPTTKPGGAFYLFPSIEKFGMPSNTFSEALLASEKLAVVPGDAFSSYGDSYIRLSYAYSEEILEEGLNRLERFISKL
ncbi:putative N-acetyl-LL-diaminopimelate aminotransferase [Pullulanibacillus camelliae]|uniref:Aminotransferase n=1 Tax=Pullulanibacillus camelliae TaxID=1707096 RepID=A0A8J2VLW9_9BACL|nr:aminotransferase A [Pullulanibacillus camelliae]GGE30369.1 putative N-acetyl-LL-diaminopimelate aminotransferase [Pullulanibacillus camelliae]